MRIAIGCDHAGYEMKEKILVKYDKINFIDCGTFSVDSVDYPDFGHKVGMCVLDKVIKDVILELLFVVLE